MRDIDQTTSIGDWFTVKWMFVSQTKLMAQRLPFLRQDLSEAVGVKKDDGEVT